MKDFRKDPIGWIVNALPESVSEGAGRLLGYNNFPTSLGRSADKVAEAMRARGQTPEVILLPDNHGMLHFPRSGDNPGLTFATGRRLNPVPVVMDKNFNFNLWDYGGHFLSTVGIDTDKGCLMNPDGCTPRAVINALGGKVNYKNLATELVDAGQLGATALGSEERGAPVGLTNQLHEKLHGMPGLEKIRDYYPGIGDLDNPWEAVELRQDIEKRREAYSLMKEHGSGVLDVVYTRRGGERSSTAHAIGFYDGKHVRSDMFERMAPDNTWAVLGVYVPGRYTQ